MSNEHWFGGVYAADRSSGLSEIDLFSAARCGNVASLYATVTGVLGFRPLKHEGKLTGLAAHGKVDARVLDVLQVWLAEPQATHGLTHWFNLYGEEPAPRLAVSPRHRRALQEALAFASAQHIAATLQRLTETHVCGLIERALQAVGGKRNLCLSGGVFSNVKLNQRVSELGVDRLFIFPAMADDGTAAGAAWQALFERDRVAGQPIRNVFLGPPIGEEEEILARRGVVHARPVDRSGAPDRRAPRSRRNRRNRPRTGGVRPARAGESVDPGRRDGQGHQREAQREAVLNRVHALCADCP